MKHISFTDCGECQGAGCVVCGQGGFVARLDGDVVLWQAGQNLRLLSRAEQGAKLARLRFVASLAVVALGVIGLGLIVVDLLVLRTLTLVPFIEQSWGAALFWLGAIGLCYVLFQRWQRKPDLLHRKTGETLILDDYCTAEVQGALQAGAKWAEAQGSAFAPLHLLGGLTTTATLALLEARLGLSAQRLQDGLTKLSVNRGAVGTTEPAVFAVMALALDLALQEESGQITTLHLLRALVQKEPLLSALFDELAIPVTMLNSAIAWLGAIETTQQNYVMLRKRARLKPTTVNRALTARVTPLLDRFSDDLTLRARAGAIPPVVGRENEITAVVQTLTRTDGNVILVGEPGVGKSAIIDGLALLMASEAVAPELQDKRLVRIDLSAIVSAGPEALPVVRRMIDEVIKSGNIILVLEQIASLVSVGQPDGVDIATMLEPLLEIPQIGIIGTALPAEYADRLERLRPDFVRRFQKIVVAEPTREQAIIILGSRIALIENSTHGIFSYQAVATAVDLSAQYLPEQLLPAKALTILEAAAVAAVQNRGRNTLIGSDDVMAELTRRTNIKIMAPGEGERDLLLHLEDKIHERLVDQQEAVFAVADALRRSRAGVRAKNRPIANMLFLGPTGVGKTELAKILARLYFGGVDKMIRLDLSEYQDASSINTLLGAPTGQGSPLGVLTEAIRRSPFALLLLDEIEKAHPTIRSLFLQLMDDGRLTDRTGRTVQCSNLIVIATSNVGAADIEQAIVAGQSYEEIKNHLVNTALPQVFAPELINRFDQVIIFHPLGQEEVLQVTRLLLAEVTAELEQQGIGFSADDAAVAALAAKGYDARFGARALRRTVQDTVSSALAKLVLTGAVQRRDTVILQADGSLAVQKATTIL